MDRDWVANVRHVPVASRPLLYQPLLLGPLGGKKV